MSLMSTEGERLQTEGEHHTAICLVCKRRINTPLDPYDCVVCMNSDVGAKRRAMERAFADTVLVEQMRRQIKGKIKRKKMRR